MAPVGSIWRPGQRVQQSGIYNVIHDNQHLQRHQVTCVYGESFPPCNHCGQNVRFKLAMAAIHIRKHKSFK
jgi:hypothetical protein